MKGYDLQIKPTEHALTVPVMTSHLNRNLSCLKVPVILRIQSGF